MQSPDSFRYSFAAQLLFHGKMKKKEQLANQEHHKKRVHIVENIPEPTLSAMLCGSVACPLLARTLGRMAGGWGAAGIVVDMGCP